MFRVLWNGKSAMNANQEKLDAISNNLANVGTIGYKSVDISFEDLMKESLDRQGYSTVDKNSFTGTGVRTTSPVRDNTQGTLQQTNQSTDLALDGDGYFRVIKSDGSYAYTRNGSFKLDETGNLVDSQGDRVDIQYAAGYDSKNGPLKSGMKNDNFKIDNNGNITVQNGNDFTVIGQVPVYTAVGSDAFSSVGDNLYVPNAGAQVVKSTNFNMMQGYVENSNVDITKEFSDMILTQRAFQLGSKAITTADEMWGMINNLKSR